MREYYAEALKQVLIHEGGYSNNAKDPGGMTNLGVTKATWEEWVGHQIGRAHV